MHTYIKVDCVLVVRVIFSLLLEKAIIVCEVVLRSKGKQELDRLDAC